MRIEDSLEQAAAAHPEKAAVVCGGRRWSYRHIADESRRVAADLLQAGLQPGDRVAICLQNGLEAVVSIFGVLKAGGVFLMVNPKTPSERLAHLLADSGAFAVISRGGEIRRITAPRRMAADGAVPDLAALVYTSGSTGKPKGVMLTHRNITAAAAAICAYLALTSDDVILNVLPLAFTYGLGQLTTSFQAAATLVLEPSFVYPQAVIATMINEDVTGLPLVPTVATLLLQQELSRYTFPHLRYITNAAAALSATKIQRLRDAFPAAAFYSMYGLTECQRATYLPPEHVATRPSSVGVAIPGTEAWVVDDQDRPVGFGVTGELVVRGPHVMAGYWQDAEATRKVRRAGRHADEAVLYTGDLFRMDDRGFLYFVERKDDIINTRGENVAPRQVEEVIAALPGVAEVAVFGIADDVLGEAIAAVVTSDGSAPLTVEGVKRHCLGHLDDFMVPKVVQIRESVPTTPTGKVSRRQLRRMAAHGERP